jgi:cobalt-zinc-cadmium efflux system membrane fusion protein
MITFAPMVSRGLRRAVVPIAILAAVTAWWRLSADPLPSAEPRETDAPVQLVAADTLGVPPEVIKSLGVAVVPTEKGPASRPLEMYGQLVLDTDQLVRIRPRFAGEVVRIGRLSDQDSEWSSSKGEPDRPLRVGDRVRKGGLLVELFSKDLGEKKSEFVDGLSQLQLDEEVLARQLKAQGAIAERTLLETERRRDADRIAVARAERTLRSWGLTDAEIDDLREEARHVRDPDRKLDKEKYRRWARFEIRAPWDGLVVERNVGQGELVDATVSNPPLFQLADFSRPLVWAWPYEEDLPALQRAIQQARPGRLPWKVRLKADPGAAPFSGTIEDIRPFIDPTQHTPAVTGRIDNPGGRWFLSGMSVQATVELPVLGAECKIPATALFQGGADGRRTYVLVEVDPKQIPAREHGDVRRYFRLRRVDVLRRESRWVYVRGRSAAKTESGLDPGERVVAAGAVELRAALEDLQSSGDH